MSSAGCANVNEEEKSCRVQSYHIIRLQYFIYFRWGEVLSLQQLLAWQAATVRRQQGGGGGHCHHCHHCLLTSLCHRCLTICFIVSDLTDLEDERAGLSTAEQLFILEIILSLNLFLKLQKSSHQDQEGIPLKTQTEAKSVGNGGFSELFKHILKNRRHLMI